VTAAPDGFRNVHGPGGRIWILRAGLPLTSEPERWDAWLAGLEGRILTREGGRSPSRVILLDGIGQAVVRRYLHGGLLAGVTRDLFVGAQRPVREIEASERIRLRGVATPEILAVYLRRSFPGFYRSCLLSRLVPQAENLRQWLGREGRDPARWGPMLDQVARALSSLHDAGCLHRDLNLGNLLVAPTGIWILDLDGAVMKDVLEIPERGASLMRLYRSLCKESGMKEPLSPRQRAFFLRHYARRDRRLLGGLSLYLRDRWARERLRRAVSRRRTFHP